MLLSKELSSSSDGCGFVFSWYSVQQCGNYWHKAQDPMCLLQGQMMVFIFCVENHLSPVAYICVRGGILSCSIIFLVQVWQWRILTIKMETLRVKSNIINFYNFVIQIFLTKETLSLCYLAIFFGFYLHYLHSEMRYDFRWVLLVVRHFLHSCLKAWDVKNCSAVLFTKKRIHRNGTWVTSEVLV